jgi:hypothetical protein
VRIDVRGSRLESVLTSADAWVETVIFALAQIQPGRKGHRFRSVRRSPPQGSKIHRSHMRMNRGNKRILIAAVVLSIVVAIFLHCVDGSVLLRVRRTFYNVDDFGDISHDHILLRTDRMIYDENDSRIGLLVNLSPHTIEVKSQEPLIYVFHPNGWQPAIGNMYTMVSYPHAYEKGWIQSGSVLPIDMSFVRVKTVIEASLWKMLELRYFCEGKEYVVYSNEFVTNESSQSSRFRTPPSHTADTLAVTADLVEFDVVSFTNNWQRDLGFVSICSDVNPFGGYPGTAYPKHTTLQRQSGEGTWQVLRPSKIHCTTVRDPIIIEPGDTAILPVGDGYSDLTTLESGVYRWHLVTYVSFPECNPWPCSDLAGAHLFTETFEP